MERITLTDQIKCVKRELAIRQAVYPKQVASRRLTQREADYEIACMQAILDTLQSLAPPGEQAAAPRRGRPPQRKEPV